MHSGETDRTAVTRLQSGLRDLGYSVGGGSDGVFGEGTGAALVAFKSDEGLQPNDAVASRGTIGRLDEYYSHEPDDPDFPDPTTAGLVELGLEAMAVARSWVLVALADLSSYVPPVGDVLVDLALDVEASFRVSEMGAGPATAVFDFVRPTFRYAERLLDPATGTIELQAYDRSTAAAELGGDHLPLRPRPGGRWVLLPAFRNVLSTDERAIQMLRLAVSSEQLVDIFALPNSPRSLGLIGNEAVRNQLAYAAFAFRRATGGDTTWRPRYRWHE